MAYQNLLVEREGYRVLQARDGEEALTGGVVAGQDLYSLVETQNAHYGSFIRKRYGEPFYTHETMEVEDVMKLGVRSV